jgi:blue copper oxidase
LLTPGQEGLLGIFEPQASFPIQATSAATTILPGKTTDLLVYEVNAGKRFLNPILRVRKGSRLTAYLSDGLQAPITIHWHGLIVNEANDGLPFQAIAPGASYQYDFTVRNRAGTYWYHTHALGATAPQVYGGLASLWTVACWRNPPRPPNSSSGQPNGPTFSWTSAVRPKGTSST